MSIIGPELSEKGNRSWRVLTPPTTEPITYSDVKEYGRIDGTEEDNLITGFCKAVREATEFYIGRALIEQTIRCVFDYWPIKSNSSLSGMYYPTTISINELELPQPPLISVTQISVLDESNVATVYSSNNFYTVTESIPGKIVIKNGCSPPMNTGRYVAGLRIDYVAGYGSVASNVPQAILEAMKLWAVAVYEDRTLPTEPPPDAKKLLSLFRVINI